MVDPNCIFCKIAKKLLPATIVYEDEEIISFKDINPRAKIHLVTIPKKHYEQSAKLLDTDSGDMIGKLYLASKKIAEQYGLTDTGYRLVMNMGSVGHLNHYHMHLLGGGHLGPEA